MPTCVFRVQSRGPSGGAGRRPEQRSFPLLHPQSCQRSGASGEKTHIQAHALISAVIERGTFVSLKITPAGMSHGVLVTYFHVKFVFLYLLSASPSLLNIFP